MHRLLFTQTTSSPDCSDKKAASLSRPVMSPYAEAPRAFFPTHDLSSPKFVAQYQRLCHRLPVPFDTMIRIFARRSGCVNAQRKFSLCNHSFSFHFLPFCSSAKRRSSGKQLLLSPHAPERRLIALFDVTVQRGYLQIIRLRRCRRHAGESCSYPARCCHHNRRWSNRKALLFGLWILYV